LGDLLISDQHLGVEDGGMQCLGWPLPLTIQIHACQ